MNNYENPMSFMKNNLGETITVRLRNSQDILGKLVAFDEHLNLMIEDATLKRADKSIYKNLLYLRGDMIMLAGKQ